MTKIRAGLIRDEDGNKQCKVCQEWKPEEAFSKHPKTADRLQQFCKLCRSGNALRDNFGITEARYQEMLVAQGGVCAICGCVPDEKKFSIDHDHSCCPERKSCGKCIRGLLCNGCNMGIGYFRDSLERLEGAKKYLQNFS